MATSRPMRSGGGLAAVAYSLRKAREAGGLIALTRRLAARNACKTCAVGMGGQRGGMRNEAGRFPEVCKKSVQAAAADLQAPLDEGFLRTHDLDVLERMSPRELEGAGRLGFPLLWRAGQSHFRRIGWEEALGVAAAGLRAAGPQRTFFYASGRASNEAGFLLQCLARLWGTNDVSNCSYYCHQASSVALGQAIGSGTATVTLDDLGLADLVVLAGANPASNHPRLITQLVHLRRRGGKVIVVNPLREVGLVRFRVPSDWRSLLLGSEVSDLYLQPHVGADVELLRLLLRRVIERGAVDAAFVDHHTTGFAELRDDLLADDPEELLRRCGVPAAQVEAAVDLLCAAPRAILAWAMGLTQHAHGVDAVQAIVNLALARGWVGRPGAGLLPIRGHSNVQGIGSMGVAPALRAEVAERLAELWGVALPRTPGLHTQASLEAAAAGQLDASLLVGGNLFAASPDRAWTAATLSRLETTVYVTTKLNEGHVHGRGRTCLILPARARDEEPQCTTQESMFNFVRLSDGGATSSAAEARSEVEILARLGAALLPPGPVDFATLVDHGAIRRMIAQVVPGYSAIGEIDRTRREFHVAGRTKHAPEFATADGRARFRVTPVPAFAPGPGELRLTTLRSEGQFNTVVYEEEDVYRGNERRDVAVVLAQDAARLGLRRDQRVRVETAAGSLEVLVRLAELPPGNLAMYYPEANALVPRIVDPASGTPVFKSVAARIVA